MTQEATLRTAEEMYCYSRDNGLGTGFGLRWGIRNFRLIERKLEAGEGAFLTFVGLHRFRSMSSHQRNFAYAVTNRRILMAKFRSFGRSRFESVPLNSIMNLAFDSDEAIGVMKIMLRDDVIQVGMSQESVQILSRQLTALLPQLQELAQELAGAAES